MLADLAVAPFPASLVHAPLRKIDEESGLPPLGNYQILMLRRPGGNEATEAIAKYATEAFSGYHQRSTGPAAEGTQRQLQAVEHR